MFFLCSLFSFEKRRSSFCPPKAFLLNFSVSQSLSLACFDNPFALSLSPFFPCFSQVLSLFLSLWSLQTRPSGPVLSAWSPTILGEGRPSPVVTLALKRLRGSGRIVYDCKGAIEVVIALQVGKRPPWGKHIDLERRILRAGGGTPVEWIKAHTSMSQRRSLGITEEDFLGNDGADVAAKAALSAPSPHIAQWTLWRQHTEKFRLFWEAFALGSIPGLLLEPTLLMFVVSLVACGRPMPTGAPGGLI